MTETEVIDGLQAIVGEAGILTGADAAPYAAGARYGHGTARCVVRPATTKEVSSVVRFCAAHGIRAVAQGANTGLVGASSPDPSGEQVVLSLSRLRKTCLIDVENRSVTVDAGVLLQDLNQVLEPHGLWFPIDLSANPSIGGMIAANTGGTRLIRYGDVRHNLLAIEVVRFEPAGETLVLGKALRKDNTGYDLKQLFVGTSGVGGVITRATLEVHPRPRQTATALVVPTSDDAVLALLLALEQTLGDYLAAFEGMSGTALRAAIEHVPNLRNPFAPDGIPDFAILIELESASAAAYTGLDLQDALNRFLEAQFETLISNAVVDGAHDLWRLRHSISEGARAMGKTVAFDISVPRSQLMPFRRAALAFVQERHPGLTVVDFGHVADGGLHFNIVWPDLAQPAYTEAGVHALRDGLYAMVVHGCGGSFSAEHGVGQHNLAYYRKYTSHTAMRIARGIRRLVDPDELCGTVDFGPPSDDHAEPP
jgi:FAD/FMN-containing dehydrogenase